MNEELKARLIKYLDGAEELTLETVEVIREQCPLLIEEILRWHFTISLIWFTLGILLLIGTVYGVYKGAMALKKYDNLEAFPVLLPTIAPLTLSLVLICDLGWLKIWIAPRVFLLEYLKDLL